jgi:hypothetical protein
MINELIKLATHLDERGLIKEADYVDALIKRAQSKFEIRDMPDRVFETIPDVIEIQSILPDLSLETIRDHAEAGNLARLKSLVETHYDFLKGIDQNWIDDETNRLMVGGDPR